MRMALFFRPDQNAGQVMRCFIFIASLVMLTKPCYSQETWPTIALPDNVTAFSVGEQMTVNGLPMRVQGFISKSKPAALLAWFRKSLGQPLVENTLANKQILGRAQAHYYLTVQIEALGQGSRGVVAVTDIKAMALNQRATQESANRWVNRLPSGSRIVSQLSSEESGRVSNQLVVLNGHSESLNRDALVNLMRADGYELKRETTANDEKFDQLSAHLRRGKMLVFNGRDKEAIATIQRNLAGSTSVVFNTVTQMERFK